jgi:uncharacterized protein
LELVLFIFVYTIKLEMLYEFDHEKSEANLAKHRVAMTVVQGFEWETAKVREDDRKRYAECRYEALGFIEGRLHVLVFCHRAEKLRVISLRKANLREVSRYANEN